MTSPARRRLVPLLAVAGLTVAGLTGSAGAAGTALGDATTADPATWCGDAGGSTLVQSGSEDNDFRVPSDGVITAWQFGTPATDVPAAVGFRLGRLDGAEVVIVGASADVPVTPGVRVERSTRIPAKAGDVLGLFAAAPGTGCARDTSMGDVVVYGDGNVTSGSMEIVSGSTNRRLSVTATLEADADADGYGDLTQDRCPTDATTRGACVAPETKAGKVKVTKLVKGKRRVSVSFSASKPGGTFQCALDSTTRFKACSSPYRAKLKVGKHVLRVRAVGSNRAVDPTPAVVRIRVKK